MLGIGTSSEVPNLVELVDILRILRKAVGIIAKVAVMGANYKRLELGSPKPRYPYKRGNCF